MLFCALLYAAGSVATAKPNVVILLADDLGWNDVGYHNPDVTTPNIDEIAKEGLELDRFYVNPTCSPTRASLMSGMFANSHGVNFPVQWHTEVGLPLEYKTLPEYFRQAGYTTHLAGKWHLGHHDGYLPNQRGFDSFYGHLMGGIGYYDHVFSGGLDWQRDGVSLVEEGYSTDLIADEAIRIISTPSDQPFLLYVSFNAPHTPIEGPGGKKEGHQGRRTYLEMVTHLDESIGKIVSALRRSSLLENTVIVFASDNGGLASVGWFLEFMMPPLRDGFGDNTPLREGKGLVSEGGVRVPAAIWLPDQIASDKRLMQPMHIADLLPTLAELVGFEVPAIDGVSQLSNLLTGEETQRPPFVVSNAGDEALIEWPWKLIKDAPLPFIPDFLGSVDWYLYNILEDEGESLDLAASEPERLRRMKQALQRYPHRSVVELDTSKEFDSFGGDITRAPWTEISTE
jgi:arylsulfatase A-like enzyme